MRYNRSLTLKLFDCMCVEVKRQIVETRVQLDAQNTPKRGVGTFSLFKIDAKRPS
jgi:hypothetical protein